MQVDVWRRTRVTCVKVSKRRFVGVSVCRCVGVSVCVSECVCVAVCLKQGLLEVLFL